ncbi:hypothetical protein SCHPADRAFT_941304 [Schizopora paradoxa]|uniref:HMG box domain-containing protein n=1 Tax=Schizopora paradoxa TaxID=27342 RepID=A0A0H2RK99_9AGAM|nr:hypothetical protein SCHPADRAFT_941304 [Schizopora paradoxa]
MFSTRLVPRLLAGAPLLRKAAIPLATRRVVVASPFSTSLLVHQAAKAATAVKKPSTSKKAAATPARKTKAAAPAKKAGKKKAVVKPAPKKRAAKKVKVRARTTKKKAAPKKQPYKLKKEDKPPGTPLSSYTLFCTKYLRGAIETMDPSQKSVENAQILVRDAAATWRGLSDHEKQAFRDEAAVLKEEYQKKRQQYNRTISSIALKTLNKQREKQGKKKIRVHSENPKPGTAFIQFVSQHFREIKESGHQVRPVEVVRDAGGRWKGMSEDEKKPYFDRYRVAMEEWKAKNQ